MKKFFSFFAALLFAGSMMAETVTITPENCGWTSTAGAQSGTVSGVTLALTNGMMGTDGSTGITALRIYKDATLTISAESNITSIVFTCVANGTVKFGPGNFGTQAGYTYEEEGPTGTWSGSAKSVTFTASVAQVRATQIVVTLEDVVVPGTAADSLKAYIADMNAYVALLKKFGQDATTTQGYIDAAQKALDEENAQNIAYYNNLFATTMPQLISAALQQGKTLFAAAIQALAQEGDNEDCQKVIGDAVTAVNALEWDDTKSFQANVEALQTAGDKIYADAVAALDAIRNPVAEPTDCATAAAAALSVSADNELFNNGAEYSIEGYVTAIKTAYSDQFHNISFWMADTKDGGNVLQAYRAACASEDDAPVVGDKVTVTGKLTKYGTTPEFAAGCTFVIASTPVSEWTEISFVEVVTADNLAADAVFEFEGLKVAITDSENKMAIDDNDANFGTAEEYTKYEFRLKTGGKSMGGDKKNFMTITVPADGTLRLAVRSGKASDETRNLVLVQDGDTIYDAIVKDADAIEVPVTDSTTTKVYPYVYATVKAGEILVGYPINGLNFYNFAFKAAEVPVDNYYLIGSMNGWSVDQAYKLVANPANEGEYMGEFTLEANDEFKIVKNDKETWYPDGMDNNYKIDQAGDYAIYFRPEGNVEGWYYGFFYVMKKEQPLIPTYDVAEAIAAAPADGSEMYVRGVITKMQIKGQNFAKYGSVCFYVADATGAEGEFEFYNCFSFNADTFKTTSPAYDATSSQWADIKMVADENGNQVRLGDTIVVFGKYKLFKTTHELDQGCYITELMPAPVQPAETIEIEFSSITTPGAVTFVDAVAEEGWWQIMAYDDEYYVSLCTVEEVTAVAGTYTADDLDMDYSGIYVGEQEVVIVSGSFTVTVAENGMVTVIAELVGDDENTYKVSLTYVEPKAEKEVTALITDAALDEELAEYGLYTVYGTDENGVYVQLAIYTEESFEGEFTEYDLDNELVGSGIYDGEEAVTIYTATITVAPGENEGEYNIVATILGYNNTLYQVVMTVVAPTEGLEETLAAGKAAKVLRNGQIQILKGDKIFNLNGAVVR